MKRLMLLLLAVLLAFCAAPWAHGGDTRLMTESEYKGFLDKVEIELPKWEAALKKIDPAKTNASYAVGKQIDQSRDLALKEAAWVRQYVAKERVRHTVSGELALRGFLESLFNQMDTVVVTEIMFGITASNLENYAPQISSLVIRIANDVTARVELLEKGCP